MAGARFSATDIRLLEVDAAFAASSPPNEDKVLNASWQRCRVNLMRNALAHAPWLPWELWKPRGGSSLRMKSCSKGNCAPQPQLFRKIEPTEGAV